MVFSVSRIMLPMAVSALFVVQSCRCFTVPASQSFGIRRQAVSLNTQHEDTCTSTTQHEDTCTSRKTSREQIIAFVKNSPEQSKKFLGVLGVSMAAWGGGTVEAARAAAPWTAKPAVATRPTKITVENHKSFLVSGTLVVTTGSAVAFKVIRDQKKGSGDEDEEIAIPERKSVAQLEKMRIEKLANIQQEMPGIMPSDRENRILDVEEANELLSGEPYETTEESQPIATESVAVESSAEEESTVNLEVVSCDGDEDELFKDKQSRVAEAVEVSKPDEVSNVEEQSADKVGSKTSNKAVEIANTGGSRSTLEQERQDEKHMAAITAELERLMEDAVNTAYPSQDKNFVEARRQPKPAAEAADLVATYTAIESQEDRAFQILKDLGMIEETEPIDIDKFAAI